MHQKKESIGHVIIMHAQVRFLGSPYFSGDIVMKLGSVGKHSSNI